MSELIEMRDRTLFNKILDNPDNVLYELLPEKRQKKIKKASLLVWSFWPDTNAAISTTPPLSESSLRAVDWNLWKDIGKKFMIKSNINDWIVCQPNGGSMVTIKHGSINKLSEYKERRNSL